MIEPKATGAAPKLLKPANPRLLLAKNPTHPSEQADDPGVSTQEIFIPQLTPKQRAELMKSFSADPVKLKKIELGKPKHRLLDRKIAEWSPPLPGVTKLLDKKDPITNDFLTTLLRDGDLKPLNQILNISKPRALADTPLKTTTIQRHTFTAGGIKYEMVVGEKPNDYKFSTIQAGKLWQAMSLTQFTDALNHLKASQTPEDYAKLEPELKRAWKAHKAQKVFSKLDQIIAINSGGRNPDADLRALFATVNELNLKENEPPKIIFQKGFKQPQ